MAGTDVAALAELCAGGRVVVLSGAGLSTESGIPDYRGPTGLSRRVTPMTYQAFTRDADARQRYWARSHLGWRTITGAAPNAGHLAVARLQRAGSLAGVVTQNVDGLHQAAGARDVIELHGGLDRVVCLHCGLLTPREELDLRLRAANPSFAAVAAAINPDGDSELPVEAVASGDACGAESLISAFRTVGCRACDGVLKPDVVFFGETVPRERVQSCFALVEGARALVVLGSSLSVMSGRRFVLRAAKVGVPVAIVNQGVTRGDDHAVVRIDAPLGVVLPELAGALTG